MSKNTTLIAVMLLATVGMVASSIGATEDSSKQGVSDATKQAIWSASVIALVDVSYANSCIKQVMPTGETVISNSADCLSSMRELEAIFKKDGCQNTSQCDEVLKHIEYKIKSITQP